MRAETKRAVRAWVNEIALEEMRIVLGPSIYLEQAGVARLRDPDGGHVTENGRAGAVVRARNPRGSGEVLHILSTVVVEALDRRLDEWDARDARLFRVNSSSDDSKAVHALRDSAVELSIRGVVRDSCELTITRVGERGRDRFPMVIDVLAAIQGRWCNIWPFCRPTPLREPTSAVGFRAR